MLQTLVVNAVQASPAGSEVLVRLHGDREGARIEVLDHDHGLDPVVAERLYQPHATTKPDGSGMGLYLTRRLAESRYRGAVALAGREGGGVAATLELKAREDEHD